MQYRTNSSYITRSLGTCRVLPTLSYRADTYCPLVHKAQPSCSLLVPEPGAYESGLFAFLFVALSRSGIGDDPHTMTADDGEFDSGMLNPGGTFMVTFEGLATLSYHCEIHPSTGARVTVAPAAEGGGTGEVGSNPVATAESGVTDRDNMMDSNYNY